MVTDDLRLCSPGPEVELVGVLPLTIDGVPTVGIAGGIEILPFTGKIASALPCCETPAAADGVDVPEVEVGAEALLVALA
jgi:hypothetical protein